MPKHLAMCAPDRFEVSYTINPWMQPDQWASQRVDLEARASLGWRQLVSTFKSIGAQIEFVPPVAGLPDLVFTANAAVVLDGTALVANFRHKERQGETAIFEAFFRDLMARGIIKSVQLLPANIALEGAGDCVWDATRQCFWMGYGPRTDLAAGDHVSRVFGQQVHALELINPHFYHMDTALCPLSGGEVLLVESAFSSRDIGLIRQIVGAENIITVPPESAAQLAANAVCLGRDLILSTCSADMEAAIVERGYQVHHVPLEPFAMSGGSAFCLTLALDRQSGIAAKAA